jgi:predicted Holliday junction resolvase-like endonuclease
MMWIVGILAVAVLVAAGIFLIKLKKSVLKELSTLKAPVSQSISLDTSSFTNHIEVISKSINELPESVLRTLTGSANTHKGKLGELIGYLTLKAEYDRIIPLGNIVDFMAIKLPSEGNPGHVDFLDIKTGDSARLNKDQRALKSILTKKLVNFKTIKIDSIDGVPDDESSTDK